MKYPKKIKKYKSYDFPDGNVVKQMHKAHNLCHKQMIKSFISQLNNLETDKLNMYVSANDILHMIDDLKELL